MPKKTPLIDPMIENMKNISTMFAEVLDIVDVSEVKVIDQLDGEARRDFCRWAHEVFHSPHFNLIIQNFVFAQVMLVTEKGWSHQAYSNGQMAVNGVQMFRELVKRHANIWETDYAGAGEKFDPFRSIPQGRLEGFNN